MKPGQAFTHFGRRVVVLAVYRDTADCLTADGHVLVIDVDFLRPLAGPLYAPCSGIA